MPKNYLEMLKEDLQRTFSNNEKMFETINSASGFARRQVLYSLANRNFRYYQTRLAVSLLKKDLEPTIRHYETKAAQKYYDIQLAKIETTLTGTTDLSSILTDAQLENLRKTARRNADRDLIKVHMRTASLMITEEAQNFISRRSRW